jgi:hypothetical protein
LLGVGLAVAFAAMLMGAPAMARAATITTDPGPGWSELVNVDNPPLSLTVRQLHDLAERAAQTQLPPVDEAVLIASNRTLTEAEVAAVLSGQSVSGAKLVKVAVNPGPGFTVGQLTSKPSAAKAGCRHHCTDITIVIVTINPTP